MNFISTMAKYIRNGWEEYKYKSQMAKYVSLLDALHASKIKKDSRGPQLQNIDDHFNRGRALPVTHDWSKAGDANIKEENVYNPFKDFPEPAANTVFQGSMGATLVLAEDLPPQFGSGGTVTHDWSKAVDANNASFTAGVQ